MTIVYDQTKSQNSANRQYSQIQTLSYYLRHKNTLTLYLDMCRIYFEHICTVTYTNKQLDAHIKLSLPSKYNSFAPILLHYTSFFAIACVRCRFSLSFSHLREILFLSLCLCVCVCIELGDNGVGKSVETEIGFAKRESKREREKRREKNCNSQTHTSSVQTKSSFAFFFSLQL